MEVLRPCNGGSISSNFFSGEVLYVYCSDGPCGIAGTLF